MNLLTHATYFDHQVRPEANWSAQSNQLQKLQFDPRLPVKYLDYFYLQIFQRECNTGEAVPRLFLIRT